MFRIPQTLACWPWPRALNPHYPNAKSESSAWLRSFGAFGETAQAAFDACDFSLLASLAYPAATMEHLRICCDLMNLFFVFDEYTDCVDHKEARRLADIVMDALRHPHKARSADEPVVGEIARQFWCRAIVIASPACQQRFVDSFDRYTESVVAQAEDRGYGLIRNVPEYLATRRENIGAKPSFALLDLGLSLHEDVLAHPCIEKLTVYAIDMLIIGNDLCSYRIEFCRGDASHNILTVIMQQFDVDLANAVLWVENYHKELVEKFFAAVINDLPQWQDTDIERQVTNLVEGLGNWVRANDAWSFESQRYFGNDGPSVQTHRVVSVEDV